MQADKEPPGQSLGVGGVGCGEGDGTGTGVVVGGGTGVGLGREKLPLLTLGSEVRAPRLDFNQHSPEAVT